MFRSLITVLYIFQVALYGSMFKLDKQEAFQIKDLLKEKEAILTVSNSTHFQYHKINTLKIISQNFTSNKFNRNDILAINNDYTIEINGKKVDLISTYIRSRHNENKWIRLGSIVDPTTFKHHLNDIYYTYTEQESIPYNIQQSTTPVINNGRPSVVMIPDDEYNRNQREKELNQVYQELEHRPIPD